MERMTFNNVLIEYENKRNKQGGGDERLQTRWNKQSMLVMMLGATLKQCEKQC